MGGRFQWGINIDDPSVYAVFRSIPVNPNSKFADQRETLSFQRHIFTANSERTLDFGTQTDVEACARSLLAREQCEALGRLLKASRIDFVRCWFPWNFFDYEDYPLDLLVETLKKDGIAILAVLGSGYDRFLPKGISTQNAKSYSRKLAESSTAIVRHYRGAINMWQIENEPNWWKWHFAASWRSGRIWLSRDAEEIILSSLYNVVRSESPKSTVVINLEADGDRHRYDLYSKFCDVIGLDFYPAYTLPFRTSASRIAFAREVSRETGVSTFVAETGYPSSPKFLGYNESRQAAYVKSACDVSYSCDAVNALCVWRLSDAGWKSFPFQENHFGLFTEKGRPKPAWTRYVNEIGKLK